VLHVHGLLNSTNMLALAPDFDEQPFAVCIEERLAEGGLLHLHEHRVSSCENIPVHTKRFVHPAADRFLQLLAVGGGATVRLCSPATVWSVAEPIRPAQPAPIPRTMVTLCALTGALDVLFSDPVQETTVRPRAHLAHQCSRKHKRPCT
jgi:hypothetical protein